MLWCDMLFLGDSLTHGSRDPNGLSWPFYLAQLAQAEGIVVRPRLDAVPGRTSAELVRAALPAIAAAPAAEAFILIGTNDAKDEVATPADQYLANVKLVQAWCRIAGLRTYVLAVPLPAGFGSPGYTAKLPARVQQYNAALRLWAQDDEAVHLIDTSDISETVDGVHFSERAARQVAERVWSYVKQLRTILPVEGLGQADSSVVTMTPEQVAAMSTTPAWWESGNGQE